MKNVIDYQRRNYREFVDVITFVFKEKKDLVFIANFCCATKNPLNLTRERSHNT